MCRFNSGFFFLHELIQKYRYYWRVEPNVDVYYQLYDDPSVYMRDNDKIYGFNMAFHEFADTIPTSWNATKEFMKLYPELLPEGNALNFISDDQGDTYNLCHFWSNSEIADLDFWRSEPYQRFFDFLDSKGGFYYERWGDAPVHSIATALFAQKDQLHFFNEIGYRRTTLQHCPQGEVHTRVNAGVIKGTALITIRNPLTRRLEFNLTMHLSWSCIPLYESLLVPQTLAL